jgi:hypothetical protein
MQRRCIGWTVHRNTCKEHLLKDVWALYIVDFHAKVTQVFH